MRRPSNARRGLASPLRVKLCGLPSSYSDPTTRRRLTHDRSGGSNEAHPHALLASRPGFSLLLSRACGPCPGDHGRSGRHDQRQFRRHRARRHGRRDQRSHRRQPHGYDRRRRAPTFSLRCNRAATGSPPRFKVFVKSSARAWNCKSISAREIDLALEVGLISETVMIAGTAPLLETQSSVLGTVIEEKQVQDLPLNGRNFVQLATLSPGVSGAGSGMRGTIMSGTRPDDLRPGTELFVNGNRENSNNYLYDGIDNNTRLTLVTVLRPNVEAIKEFKVQTNLYSADQGRNPGGQINVVTKSGGNTMHGVVLRVPAQRQVRRQQFLRQPRRAGQTAVRAESVRRRYRRADYREQDVLLRRLRRVPPGAGARVRQHRADREDAAGRLQRSGDDLRSADDGCGSRRRVTRQPFPGNRHSARPLGPGDGEVDERVSAADHVRVVQQPGHDPVAHPELESVRRARRSHARANGTTSLAVIPGRRPRRSTRTHSLPSSFRVCRRPSVSATRTPLRVLQICGPSTRCSAGCMCSRRASFWTRAPATTTSISSSRKPTSSPATSSANSSACPTPTSRSGRMASRSSARRTTRASVTAARCRSSGTRRCFNM